MLEHVFELTYYTEPFAFCNKVAKSIRIEINMFRLSNFTAPAEGTPNNIQQIIA